MSRARILMYRLASSLVIWGLTFVSLSVLSPRSICANDGQLVLNVIDKETGQPLPCRIHLKNASGRPVRVPHTVAWGDHFYCDGKVTLKLPIGNYSFLVERGLEYLEIKGQFRLETFADDVKTIELRRFCDMAKEGWYSGDFDVERADKDLDLLMRADDLHVIPLTSFGREKSAWLKRVLPAKSLVQFADERYCDLFGGEDELAGGTLQYLNLDKPIALLPPAADKTAKSDEKPAAAPNSAKKELPLLDHVAGVRRQSGAWINARSSGAWDLPMWVALGRLDSIEVLNRQFCRDAMLPDPANSKPRDAELYPPPMGIGRWSGAAYFQLLNCGLRIPPSAGSGTGVVPNAAGYNRLYVYCGEQFSYDKWWAALRAGQVVLSNGPLIRPTVEGHPPGHVFSAAAGETLDLEIALTLSTREKIRYLEIIQDGRIIHEIRLEDFQKAAGKLPHVKFDTSGWFLVRAVVDSAKVYRCAMSGPFYVQIGDQPRISRKSAKMFLDWVDERKATLSAGDRSEREVMLAQLEKARQYWQSLAAKANAD